MPRNARVFIDDVPLHVIQRGNNRNACFLGTEDYAHYLECLRTAARRCKCAVHAYVLMTNHVHLLLSPARAADVPVMMSSVAQKHAQYINWRYRRTGTVWEGRYRPRLFRAIRIC
ncbi:transposase [Pseudoduganella chitinolytica]|uniref:transposase n=1 Tax=Pseudoduganella chitinolytica TaxID=34070 RepID=UPI00353126C6